MASSPRGGRRPPTSVGRGIAAGTAGSERDTAAAFAARVSRRGVGDG